MLQIFIGPLAILLSFSTSAGIFLPETKVDRLAELAIAHHAVAEKKVAEGALLESMPHTHSHVSSLQTSSREFRTASPGMTPRRDRDEKYRLGKKVARGYHLFDSYHLPIKAWLS